MKTQNSFLERKRERERDWERQRPRPMERNGDVMEKFEDQAKINDDIKATVRSNYDDEREDLEEGEIVDDDDTASSVKPTAAANHPLEHSWTFWFDNRSVKSKQASKQVSKQDAWGSSIRPIHTFSSVEQFWSLYNNIRRPSNLAQEADLHCFKNQIDPKWEDPICANGGTWTATFQIGKSDTAWLYTLLAMIGEQFDHGGEICGAVVNVRARQERIGLWTKNAANEAAQMSIGKQWKEFLDYNDTIGFIFHEEAMKLGRGAKNRYTA